MVDRLANTEENTRRVKAVEECFGATGLPLCKKGRVLVGEGVLTKLCRKKPKPRQFFLFNDLLVYGTIIINKKLYNKQHLLPLEEVKIIALEDDGNFENGWQIISPSKSFAVYAATLTEKNEWMAHINKCISDLIKKTGKKPSGDRAAVWVPDQSTNNCMYCKKTKFTALMRRHHCRRCGLVVCSNCSSKRFLIPHISSKPVRVCDGCYEKMSSGEMSADDNDAKNDVVDSKPAETAAVVEAAVKKGGTLSRNESEKIAESGSSAEESDDEDEKESENKTTFYEEQKSEESQQVGEKEEQKKEVKGENSKSKQDVKIEGLKVEDSKGEHSSNVKDSINSPSEVSTEATNSADANLSQPSEPAAGVETQPSES